MDCSKCKKLAKLTCGGCKGCPVIPEDGPVVHYCSAECQRADWNNHKPTCFRLKDRQIIYRVAEITQKFFYIFLELTWCHWDIEAVERIGQDLVLRGQFFENSKWPADYIVFPSRLFVNTEDREAVLGHRACREATIWETEFSSGFLKGIIAKTEHLDVRTKNNKRHVQMLPRGISNIQTTDHVLHEMLKVTLRSGEAFAFDIAGAQYGYPEPITPWKQYKEGRILNIVNTLSSPKSANLVDVEEYSLEKMAHLHRKMLSDEEHGMHMSGDTIATMAFHLVEWQMDEKMSLKDMWKLPEEKFHTKADDLVDFMEWKFNSVREKPWFTVRGQKLQQTVGSRWVHGK
ncbi:hypothetical protein JHW43_000881 [Diplocarpon mali]|nr:hypothetical protein JHW43_000881 [Diplocarpon mali]